MIGNLINVQYQDLNDTLLGFCIDTAAHAELFTSAWFKLATLASTELFAL